MCQKSVIFYPASRLKRVRIDPQLAYPQHVEENLAPNTLSRTPVNQLPGNATQRFSAPSDQSSKLSNNTYVAKMRSRRGWLTIDQHLVFKANIGPSCFYAVVPLIT